jgi:mono/diheme cytochrome c family protein
LARYSDGSWDTTGARGLPAASLDATVPGDPPSLIIRPFSQAGNVVSLRQFTVNAFNHHHGIQATERFGHDADLDGDGFTNELTSADVTAVALFQAALPVPGRVIPRDPAVEQAVRRGEDLFGTIGCIACHVPALPLDRRGWIFSEPNPFNPAGTTNRGRPIEIDLTRASLPGPTLAPDADGVLWVPAFTDLKLHDITRGPDDPNREPLDMNEPGGTAAFYQGNAKFLTRKLWGAGNSPPYFHHGQYTTLREAIEAHHGEAQAAFEAWRRLADEERDAIIEFLKSLQMLPPGTKHRIVDERSRKRSWPVFGGHHTE